MKKYLSAMKLAAKINMRKKIGHEACKEKLIKKKNRKKKKKKLYEMKKKLEEKGRK